MISKESAAQIVEMEHPNATPYEKMRLLNQVMEVNGGTAPFPFAEVDIRFMEFIHFLKMEGSQREKDMVVVSEKFYRVWTTLHVSVQVMNEPLTPHDEDEIQMLAPALQRLGLQHLLLKDLKAKWAKKVHAAVLQDVKQSLKVA